MITFLDSLLQCIGQNVCTNFIQVVISLQFFICVSIIVFQYLYFVILMYQGPVRLSWRAFLDHKHSNGHILCLWQYS